jgi:hypothetical protein
MGDRQDGRQGDEAVTTQANGIDGRGWSPWRIAGWGLAAFVLLLPLVAMQFTREVNWTGFDFLFAGVMVGGVGLLLELTVRLTSNGAYRAGVGAALAAGFLIVWANGAVGMIGSEHNPYNLLFAGVIVLALLGSIVAGFRAGGMALAMLAAGIAHAGVAVGGMPTDLRGGVVSLVFAAPWLVSAALFRKVARAA